MEMKWFLLLLTMAGNSIQILPPPERSYKILMLLPVSCKSHRGMFMSLAESLAGRGHEVVVLSNSKEPKKGPNLKEITHDLPDFDCDSFNIFQDRKNKREGNDRFLVALPAIARKLYKVPQVKELYERRNEFDLFIINHLFNELTFPFAHGRPFITIAIIADPKQSAILGNPWNPAYVLSTSGDLDLSGVTGRLKNVYQHIQSAFYWRISKVIPRIQKEITAQFPDLPPLLEIERNQSLTLMNTHFSWDMTLPLLPSQIEVGGLHCRPAKSLPEDLETWIEGAGSAGVVYFSLGSIARGDTVPVELRNLFIDAFRRLDQRVIWKFESNLKDVPKNVLIRKWLPQQDILAHRNVKVFITHGGLLSTQEASYHGIPILVLPTFADQFKNARKVVQQGMGLALEWKNLTAEAIVKSLREIIVNDRYRQNMLEVSRLFQDQLETPMERALFWTEYVIRHKGAPKLRSPAVDLSWVEFLLLDVITLLLLMIFISVFIFKWIISTLWIMVFGNKGMKKKVD